MKGRSNYPLPSGHRFVALIVQGLLQSVMGLLPSDWGNVSHSLRRMFALTTGFGDRFPDIVQSRRCCWVTGAVSRYAGVMSDRSETPCIRETCCTRQPLRRLPPLSENQTTHVPRVLAFNTQCFRVISPSFTEIVSTPEAKRDNVGAICELGSPTTLDVPVTVPWNQ
jgi:hypothetical protein